MAKSKRGFLRRIRRYFRYRKLLQSSPPKMDSLSRRMKVLWREGHTLPHSRFSFKKVFRFLSVATKRNRVPDEIRKKEFRHLLTRAFKSKPPSPLPEKKTIQKQWKYLRTLFKISKPPAPGPTKNIPTFRKMFIRSLDRTSHRYTRTAFKGVIKGYDFVLSNKLRLASLLVLTPVLLEVLLQLSSLFVWMLLDTRQTVTSNNSSTILCVGDSFTSGKYASGSQRPYTDFLNEILTKRGDQSWNIVNISSSQMNSKTATKELDVLLQANKPAVLYLMIGVNDFLSKPGLADIPDRTKSSSQPKKASVLLLPDFLKTWKSSPSYQDAIRLLVRPPFFLTQNAGKLTESRNPEMLEALQKSLAPQPLPEGKWFSNLTPFEFLAESSPNASATSCVGKENYCQQKTDGQNTLWLWETDEGSMVLQGEEISQLLVLTRTASAKDSKLQQAIQKQESGWQHLNDGLYQKAISEFQRSLTLNPQDPLPRAALAAAHFELGAHHKAKIEISHLQKQYNEHPSLPVARALAFSLQFGSSTQDASKVLVGLVQRYPRNPWLWERMGWYSFLHGDHNFAGLALNRAVELVPPQMPSLRASLLRRRGEILQEINPEKSLQDVIDAFLLDRKEDVFTDAVQNGAVQYFWIDQGKFFAKLQIPQSDKHQIRSLVELAIRPQVMNTLLVLETRLNHLVSLCRQNGVRLVLTTYPLPRNEIDVITRKVSERSNVTWLKLNGKFGTMLATDIRQDFLKFGQPTAGTSRFIANMIADDISEWKSN